MAAADPVTVRADVALSVSGPTYAAGKKPFTETVTVTVTVNGPNKATGVATNVYIPPGLTVIAAPRATTTAGTLDWFDHALATGKTITYRVHLRIDAGIHGTATIGGVTEGDGSDPDPTNNAAITTVQLG